MNKVVCRSSEGVVLEPMWRRRTVHLLYRCVPLYTRECLRQYYHHVVPYPACTKTQTTWFFSFLGNRGEDAILYFPPAVPNSPSHLLFAIDR
jgi:hypothetical protein